MTAVAVSPKFQVVIPKDIRRQLDIKPGQKVDVLAVGGTIHIVPVASIRSLKGAFPGIATEVDRDDRDLP
ncbi:MAG: AbrB/MazE/SpoVT family DNA-binding domain-containing protein [Planctomycetota bacterium]